jgi:hypothetical protein
MTKRNLQKELELLKNDCQDSPYWNTPPRKRNYITEYEEKEERCDNLILEALMEYDNICGYKEGKKVCFQKHCSHKEYIEEIEDGQEEDTNEKHIDKEKYQIEEPCSPLDLLIRALEMMNPMLKPDDEEKEEQKKDEIEMVKLVPYDDTDNEENGYDTDDTMSENEEEMIKGQVPMYLLPVGFKFGN